MNSRRKGARLEREAAAAIRRELGLTARRAARNGVAGAEDITGTPGIHFEVKGRRSIGAVRFLDQAMEERAPDEIPAVIMREDAGCWVVMIPLTDVTRFAQLLPPSRPV